MSYFGSYNHQLDQKYRLRIPARLKAELGNDFVIVKGLKNCLYIYSKAQFDAEFGERMKSISAFSKEDEAAREGLRKIMATMDIPEEDNQGRFILKSKQRDDAKIVKDVVFVGMLDRIELWAKEVYDKVVGGEDEKPYDDVISVLGNYGI